MIIFESSVTTNNNYYDQQQLLMIRSGSILMKTYSQLRLAFVATALFLSVAVSGQNRHPDPSRKGFWVVESQPKKPCTVYFYNNDHQLIYQEVLAKKQLNIRRAATRQSLNAVLDQALRQWAQNQQPDGHPLLANQQWLASEFKK